MNHVHIATYQDAAKKLADVLPNFGVPVVVRLGGKAPYAEYLVQINSAQAINNSINKDVQKHLLLKANLATLPIIVPKVKADFPCVVKANIRSCGNKVVIVNNKDEYHDAVDRFANTGCYTEPLFEATSEYRFHCTRDEVFFEVKKIKRNPDDILINSKNHYNTRQFLKPRLYEQIKEECLKAMAALDLDIACFDVMYCSKDNHQHKFAIAEANTNPELLKNTFDAYKATLEKLIQQRVALVPAVKKDGDDYVLTEAQKVRCIQAILNGDYNHIVNGGLISIKL